jgi:hypothetical protein
MRVRLDIMTACIVVDSIKVSQTAAASKFTVDYRLTVFSFSFGRLRKVVCFIVGRK